MADQGIVALLFTDLVGSTSMYDRIGDHGAEALRRAHFAELRGAIEAHGGREVKSLGDGLMVVFSSAVAALEAAIEMQRVSQEGHGRSHPIDIRVGIHAGEPLRDEGDYFGVSVNIAKRLCDSAVPGQILVSDLIRALVSPRVRNGLRALGPYELRGIEDPVSAFEFDWRAAVAPNESLPPMLSPTAGIPFAGRQEDAEELVRLWERAMAGSRVVALVAGEPGIGKTRLVQEVARRITAGPSVVMAGRSDAELRDPLRPFVEALLDAVTRWPEGLGELLRVPQLEPLLGSRRGAVAETERATLFAFIEEALVRAQERSPLLLVLDDLHWADETTLLLLRHLIRAPLRRCLIMATYRDTEVSRTHPLGALLADLRREDDVHRLRLRGLPPADVEAMLGLAGGGETATALARKISDATDGNPFFVAEVFRHLVEQHHVHRDGNGWTVVETVGSIAVPEGVREVIGRRLSRLSGPTNELLGVASVVGRQFPIRLVGAIADVSLEEALDAIDESMAAGVVIDGDEAGSFAFSHALVRESLYAEVSTVQRLRLHARAGDRLLASGGPPGEIAHHLLEAAPVGSERTMGEAAVAAAADARYRLAAYEDAATIARRALAALTDHPANDDLRCDLLTILGDAALVGGNADGIHHLDAALPLALRLDDPGRVARITTFALRSAVDSEHTADHLSASADVLRQLPPEARAERARVRAVRALLWPRLQGMPPAGEARAALAEALEVDDREAIGYAALARADELILLGRPLEATAVLDASTIAIEELSEGTLPFVNRYFEIAILLGDRELAERRLEECRTHAERFQTRSWSGLVPGAGLATLDGQLDLAHQQATEALSLRTGTAQAMAVLATLSLERGEAGDTVEFIEVQARQSGLGAWAAAVALFLVDLGREEEARRWAAPLSSGLGRQTALALGAALGAEVAWRLRDRELAGAMQQDLLDYEGLTAAAGALCLGSSARYLALCSATLGDLDGALTLLDRALDENQRLRAPLFVAHCQLDAAEVLRQRGDVADLAAAAAFVDAAAVTGRRLDLPRVARRAAALA
jgi:class 3 adenylate cyclase